MPRTKRDAAQIRKAITALRASSIQVIEIGMKSKSNNVFWRSIDTAQSLTRMARYLDTGAFQKAFDMVAAKRKNVYLREWTPAAFWTLFEE